MQTLEIVEPVKNAEVFGKINVICRISDCTDTVNDWALTNEAGCLPQSFRFLYSLSGKEEPCRTDYCEYRICLPDKNECIAVFEWDTTMNTDGPHTLTLSANGLTASTDIIVLNHQTSYRILNKKLINSAVNYINDYTIEFEVSPDIFELIESLPLGVLVDQEAGIHERFTLPTSSVIIGNQLVERVLDLKDSSVKKIGDTIYVTVLPSTAKYFSKEFATTHPKIQIGQVDSSVLLEREITTIDPLEFPATNTEVFENE